MASFHAHSTAEDVVAGLDLRGKNAVITGGTSGLGKETARVLSQAGANVLFSVRDMEKGRAIEAALNASVPQSATCLELDLMSLPSIDRFCGQVASKWARIDLLILNAGVMSPVLKRNAQGIEAQFMTNYAGHLVIAATLAHQLIAAAPSRIVCLTSSGHKQAPVSFDDINFDARPYDGLKSYGQSKTASALLAVELNKRLASRGVLAFAVHPGVILDTELSRYVGGRANEEEQIKKYGVPREALKSVGQGAATTLWAATAAELAATGGGVYLEDCRVSVPSPDPNPYSGVLPYALDLADGERLWSVTARMLGRTFQL